MAAPPKYAIVRLRPGDDVFQLFRLLVQAGYPEVSFINNIRDDWLNVSESSKDSSPPVESNADSTELNGEKRPDIPTESAICQEPDVPKPENPNLNSNSAMTQLRQRGSRAQSDDPSVYAVCRLCQNRIMASRLSNLTNHVRRHAILKQFQCCYCEYTHNEMAKVRLHMLHNHKDKDSQPIDNLSPEMQAQWDILMDQCFPDYNRETFCREPKTPISMVQVPEPRREEEEVESETCVECGELVNVNLMEAHMEEMHAESDKKTEKGSSCCSACDYEAPDEWKVRLHISLKHDEQTAAKVVPRDERWLHEPIKIEPELDSANEQLFRQLSDFSFLRPDALSDSPGNLSNLRCELCHKLMLGSRPLSSLLSHAKRHYHLKQFQCTECAYCSSEAAHVRSHMKLRHKIMAKTPLDNKTPALQAAWMQIMARCFPSVAPKLGKFRFKNFRAKHLSMVVNEVNEDLQDLPVDSKSCRLCNESISEDSFLEHASSHIAVNQYGCSVCQFRAADYGQLKAHLLKHKLSGDEKHTKAKMSKMAADTGALKAQYVKFCFGDQL